MHTPDAYAALFRELESLRQLPLPDVLALVGSSPIERVVDVSGERVEVEVVVTRRDKHRSDLLVTAHRRGPSTWAFSTWKSESRSRFIQIEPMSSNFMLNWTCGDMLQSIRPVLASGQLARR